MHKEISSTQNPRVKHLVQLRDKSKVRRNEGTFLIEGNRELQLAIAGGYTIETILICEAIKGDQQSPIVDCELILISKEVYQKLAYRATTEGIIAVATSKNHSLDTIKFKTETPLILVAEAPEKPGNIGALLRTADAAALDAVLIANPKTDLYNPNIIRSSVGCVFTNKIATGTTAEIIDFLKNKNIQINCTALTAAIPYHTQNFKQASAIVVGTEATGLSDDWLTQSDQNIIIPMNGVIDSMNVSVAAAIVIFEATRQRTNN